MHLLADGAGVEDSGHVGGNHGGNAGLAGRVDNPVHEGDVLVVEHRIYSEIGFYPLFGAESGNFAEVTEGEVGAALRAHIEALHTEIHGIGAGA